MLNRALFLITLLTIVRSIRLKVSSDDNRLTPKLNEGDEEFVSCDFINTNENNDNHMSKGYILGSQIATSDDVAGPVNFYLSFKNLKLLK